MSKILIVEDDLSIQALLHDFIQEAGHSVTLASDGVEALAKYSEQDFDLVLLDVMLPKIDGYGVCEVIRQKSDVPIIMLTALDGEENQIRGLDLQADDYITKPFYMPVLLRKIAAVLRRSARQSDEPQTINSISHPSNRFYIVSRPKFLPQILDMGVNDPFFPKKLIFPKSLQEILSC